MNKQPNGQLKSRDNGELHVDLRACWLVLRSNWHLLLAFGIAAMCFAGIFTFFFQRPIYRSSVMMKLDSHAARMGAAGSGNPFFDPLGGSGDGPLIKLQTQIDYFRSPDFAELLISKFAERPLLLKSMLEVDSHIVLGPKEMDLLKEGKFMSQGRRFELGRALMLNLNMISDATGYSLLLYGESMEPQLAYQLTSMASQVLLDENYRKVLSKVTKSRVFLEDQTKDLRRQLKAQETEMVKFQNQHRIFSVNDAQSAIYENYTRNRERAAETRRQISANEALQGKLSSDLKKLRIKMTDPGADLSDLYLSQLRHRKDVLQYQKALIESGEGKSIGHLENNGIEAELQSVAMSYRNALENKEKGNSPGSTPYEDYQILEKNLSDLKQTQEKLLSELRVLDRDLKTDESRVSDLPVDLQNLAVLRRNIEMTSELYVASKKKLQETEFAEAETVNDLYLLVHPRVPQMPAGMGISRMFIYAFFIGLLIGTLVILLKDILIHTVRSHTDFGEMNVEFLAGIVSLNSRLLKPAQHALSFWDRVREQFKDIVTNSPPVLVLESLPESLCADNFRALRLKLLSMLSYDSGMHGKTLMVSSPVKGCGKSFVAANLASALAHAEMKTLLIDLNLRRPALSKFFPRLDIKGGMETIEKKVHDVKSLVTSAAPSLDVLLAANGAAHPPDLFESKEFRMALDQLRQDYDFIVVDTPAILSSIDSSLISSMADAIILVANYNNTFTEDVKLAADSLRRSGEKEIFGVINFLDSENSHRVG